jgi:Flp pilus assembly protein CpaB
MHKKLALTSLAFGLLALVVLRVHLDRLEARITGGSTIRVLTLTSDLPSGAVIRREVLGTRELPQAFHESRHVAASELEQVIGSALAIGAQANDTLQWTDLASMRPKARQLSSLIPHGMRAMTLRAAGLAPDALISPGDRVDVLRVGGSGGPGVVLQDVIVLAVGDDIGGPAAATERKSGRAGAITVSVTLEQSRVLAEAEQAGPLRLVMRNPDDVALSGAGSL